jgi:hypothetical protein
VRAGVDHWAPRLRPGLAAAAPHELLRGGPAGGVARSEGGGLILKDEPPPLFLFLNPFYAWIRF